MLKSQIAKQINRAHPALNKAECVKIVNVFFDHIVKHLISNGAVEFRDFGRLTVKHHKPKTMRDPRTGETCANVTVASVMFRTSKNLHALLNPAE